MNLKLEGNATCFYAVTGHKIHEWKDWTLRTHFFSQQPYQSLLTIPINVYHLLLLIMARTFCLSVFFTNCLSVSLSLCPSVFPSPCLLDYLSLCFPVFLTICLSVSPSPCLLDYLSLCLLFSFTFTYLFFLFNSLFIVILKPFFIHSLANNLHLRLACFIELCRFAFHWNFYPLMLL